MKYEFQIRTAEFEYIKGEVEGGPEGAVEAFKSLKIAWNGGKAGPGLETKDWNQALSDYLKGLPLQVETWEKMDEMQKFTIKEIKKARNRK